MASDPRESPRLRDALDAVQAKLAADDISDAIILAGKALDEGMEHPLFLNLRAYDHERREDMNAALEDLERAAAIAPDDAAILNALGLALGKLERWDQAIAAFDRVIALQPDFAPAHYNKGWNHEFSGDLELAVASYAKALELNPRYAEPLSRSAGVAVRRGAWKEADAMAQEALALDERQFFALQTRIRAAIAAKDFDAAELLIERHLADSRARPLDQALTYGYLGDLRSAQRRYAEAFAAFSEGNARQRALFEHRYRRPELRSAADCAAWLADYIETAPASDLAAPSDSPPPGADEAKTHVFLVGSPRSGTTLLENVLISHPQIISLEERPTLLDAVTEFLTSDWDIRRLATPSRRLLENQRRHYWERVRGQRVDPAGKIFIDKHPLYLINLLVVAKLFPRAKILFALRDPRDVVLSCFRHTFQMNRSMFEYLTLEGAARFYDQLMRVAMAERDKLGLAWYELRHERLVEDFEAETRRVCAFIGVEWDADILNFATHARSRYIATPSGVQVMKGLSKEGLGQWRHFREQLAPVMPILQPWIERFGYEPE